MKDTPGAGWWTQSANGVVAEGSGVSLGVNETSNPNCGDGDPAADWLKMTELYTRGAEMFSHELYLSEAVQEDHVNVTPEGSSSLCVSPDKSSAK